MAQLYVYDASRELGFSISEDGLYQPRSYKPYCVDDEKAAYIIKIHDEIAGFFLLSQKGFDETSDWKIDQFFILGKFQRCGVGSKVAKKIWQFHPGKWEVPVIPENKSALKFWGNVIEIFAGDNFTKVTKLIDFDKDQPNRIIFTFNTNDFENKVPQ